MELQQEFEMVEVDRLREHPRNPRKGNTEVIRESIEKNGFYGAVIVQRSTGRILAGNHRWKAAKLAGESKVPVAWVDVDEEHATRILLADNKTNDLAEYNNEALASLLTELSESSDLGGTGFTVTDLDLLLADINGADFEPGGELEQGRLDKLEAQFVTCPKCNHEFVSK
jgi:ParB-like chromosome segregation protein Spo0J